MITILLIAGCIQPSKEPWKAVLAAGSVLTFSSRPLFERGVFSYFVVTSKCWPTRSQRSPNPSQLILLYFAPDHTTTRHLAEPSQGEKGKGVALDCNIVVCCAMCQKVKNRSRSSELDLARWSHRKLFQPGEIRQMCRCTL